MCLASVTSAASCALRKTLMLDSLHHVFGSHLASERSAVCLAIISDAVESSVGVEVQLARMSIITRACVGEVAWHSANIPSTQLY